jgi:predicted DNA-binding transcriptional regulator YafY
MLQLMGLLQSRDTWIGSELAERLDVTERTVRRDVDRLRQLGYPVEAISGRHGGYRLGRGGRLPPLLLSDDEAVAVAIGLREAIDGSVAGLEESVVGVLAKLEQLLPIHLARQVRTVHDNTRSLRDERAPNRIPATRLLLLTNACSTRQRVRFDYSDRAGLRTSRLVEPIGVVRHGARWYLAARDTDRKDWRTFRLDRLTNPKDVGTTFEISDPPSAVDLVSVGLASMPLRFHARIKMPLPAEDTLRLMPPMVAVLESHPGSTVVEIGSTSMERMASFVAGLRPAAEILDPLELRADVAAHAAAVMAANPL